MTSWASSLGRGTSLSDAVARAAEGVRRQLGEEAVSLSLWFVSQQYREAFDRFPDLVQEHLPSQHVAGCSGAGVIGGGEEEEDQPAVAVLAGRPPGLRVQVRSGSTANLPSPDAPPAVWRSWLGQEAGAQQLIVLADPFTPSLQALLDGLEYSFPGASITGGLASGGRQPGHHGLFAGREVRQDGWVLVSLSGLRLDSVVAQGCRPIGTPLTVTQCDGNVLEAVDDRPPLTYLAELMVQLGEPEKELMRRALFLGLGVDTPEGTEAQAFLIRNLVGIDYQRGVLAVGSALRRGQLVQFHLRDKASSAADVEDRLCRYRSRTPAGPVAGLLFECLGRGRRLYGEQGRDTRAFRSVFGGVPLAGFFCNGEIGPVGGSTQLLGYTASFGLILDPARG